MGMKSIRLISLVAVGCIVAITGISRSYGVPHSSYVSTKNMDTPRFSQYVDHKGNISFPYGFKDWQHLGSWAVIGEDKEGSALHNVYAPKNVAETYRTTGKFPDGAPIVKEVLKAPNADHTTGNAYWADDVAVRFFMIKDAKGRFKENPLWGEGWGWALFKGEDTKNQVATNFRTDCLGCHVPAKDTDWIYVYGYPVLGKDVKKHSPIKKTMKDKTPMGAMDDAANMAADLEKGKKVFAQCKACHSTVAGQHRVGPSLAGVAGRTAGTAEGYKYSAAMKAADFTWNAETLDMHLSNVKGFVPGNKMATLFRRNISKEADRKAVIKYLLTL